jgi:two-component system alkaline phosphatase synthesis response regulator PhoP
MAKTAFVVEDEENIREIIRCSVESCGLSVTGFEDAVQMLNEIEKQRPEFIILDIMLPGIDGLEALRRLKSNHATDSIPVILLTAKSSETDKVAGLDLGADDYITKPFGVLELMARVRTAMRRGGTKKEDITVFQHKGLLLDTDRHEVYLDNNRIELTLKEFDLLKMLMQNSGRVIQRDTLLDEVWGYGYGGETRTLDMHIRSLRQKLNDDSTSGGYITTVRGVGYKFNA